MLYLVRSYEKDKDESEHKQGNEKQSDLKNFFKKITKLKKFSYPY